MRLNPIVRSAFLLCIAIAAVISSPAAAEDMCNLGIIAKLPMTVLRSGRIGVPMSVGGKTLTMLVDTGGFLSMLSPESVASLGLTPEPLSATAEVYQYGGLRIDHYVTAHDVALARLKAGTLQFLVMPRGGYLPDEEGLLAPDILSGFDVEFDFANASLNLIKPNDCSRDPVYWTRDPFGEVDISRDEARHIFVQVTLDGQHIKAWIDTGASETVARLERIEDRFDIDEKNPNLKAVSARPDRSRYRYPFKALSFEGVTVNNPDILLVPDAQSKQYGEPEIILGMNVLRELHLYIAYGKRKLYLTSASAH